MFCIINYMLEMKFWSVSAEGAHTHTNTHTCPKAKDVPHVHSHVCSCLQLCLRTLTLQVQVPGSCRDLRCDFRVDLYSVEVAGVPWYHHVVPLIVIKRFIWAPFDEVSTISQIKHVMQVPGKKGEVRKYHHCLNFLMESNYILQIWDLFFRWLHLC